MVRKQLYLEEQQDRALKRKAKGLGVSEAELVRRALDAALSINAQPKNAENSAVLSSLFDDADMIAKTYRFGEGHTFERQALYEEDKRHTRWD